MTHSGIDLQAPVGIQILGLIDALSSRFTIASTLHHFSMQKRQGQSVRSLIRTNFTLPSVGNNFFRGIGTLDTPACQRTNG